MKHSILKKLAVMALVFTPMTAFAEHMDVIEHEFKAGCSPAKLQLIVNDFNIWAKDYGYHAKIAYPTFSENLTHFFWLGTSKDGATFGAAYDQWLAELRAPESTPAKLNERLDECVTTLSRASYEVN